MCQQTGSCFGEWDDLREIALGAAQLPHLRERLLNTLFDIYPEESTKPLPRPSAAHEPTLSPMSSEAEGFA